MSNKVLVAYATRYGSTHEVAKMVAATLREEGLIVDVRSAAEVRDLGDYRAVVVGAPLYMFNWLKEARSFVARHRASLERVPVAVFALGPTADKEKDWQETRGQLDKVLAGFPWLRPAAVELFGGKFDPARLTFPYTLIPAMKHMPASDIRDWDAVRNWAGRVFKSFG